MRESAVSAALLLAAGLAGSAAGQSAPARQPPRFGTGVDMIRLNVSVTEGGARYVTGLSQGDFAVFEDGQPQQVSFFAREPLPMSLSVLIDCSASMEENLPAAQVAAGRFIQTLGERDLGQVIQFNERTSILQDYTATGRLEGRLQHASLGPTSLYTALYVALKGLVAQEEDGSAERAIVLLSDGRTPPRDGGPGGGPGQKPHDRLRSGSRATVLYQQREGAGRATHF
jgi:VWFA-related protein